MTSGVEGQYTYEAIGPLIAGIEQNGEKVTFSFRCPATAIEVEATIIPGETQVEPPDEEKPTGFFALLDSLFGEGNAGPEEEVRYDEDEIEDAAVWAFRAVATNFFWDGQRWIWWDANDAVVEFHEQMDLGPVRTEHDREMLARVLVQVIKADGQVKPEEVDFFARTMHFPGGRLPDYPTLTEEALRSVTDKRVRETILMLGYCMACCDEDLASSEDEMLEVLAEGLEIPRLKAWELKRYAQYYLIDQAFARSYRHGIPDPVKRMDALRLATGLGIDLDEAQRVEIRYRKREGIS